MRSFATALTGLLLGLSATAASAQALAPARSPLFNAVDTLAASPGERADIERAFGVRLRVVAETALRHDYAFGPVSDSVVQAIDFRSAGPENGSGFRSILVLDIGGPCLRRDEVGALYLLRPGSVYQPHATDQVAYYDQPQPWGRLSFGFRHATGCLSAIIFDREAGPA